MHSARDEQWMDAFNAQALIWRCFGLFRESGQLDHDLKTLFSSIKDIPSMSQEADGIRAGGMAISELRNLVLDLMVRGRDTIVAGLGDCPCPRCTELRMIMIHCLDAIQGVPPCSVQPGKTAPEPEKDPEPADGFDRNLADQLLRQVFGDGAA